MKRYVGLFLILCVAVSLTGCWDYLEVATLTFVMGAGIDAGPGDNLTLTVETLAVKSGDSTEMSPYVTKTSGLTLFNALRNMTNVTGKQMFFGHSHALVFSEEFARRGVGPAVGFMQRDVGIRTNMWLFVARGSSAEDVFKADPPLGISVGEYLERVMEVQHRNPIFIPMQVWEFNRALSEVGLLPILPVVELIELDDKKIPRVAGTAVFREDRLVGWLDERDTRILGYLRLRNITGVITTELEYGGERKRVAAEVTTSTVEMKPQWKDDELSMGIDVKLSIGLHEIGFQTFDYSQPELKRMLEEAFARQLKADIEHLMKTLQEDLKSDVVGFGNLIRKKKPSAWRKVEKDWDEEFCRLPVAVRVAVLITETGILAKPLIGRP